METRTCIKCGVDKPATTGSFRLNARGTGLRRDCRACEKDAAARLRRLKGVPERRELIAPKGYKRCSKCEKIKPATLDYWHKAPNNRLHASCKECRNAQIEAWRMKNRERVSEKARQHYRENRDRLLDYHKDHYRANRVRILERNKTWQRENPDKAMVITRNYQISKINRTPDWLTDFHRSEITEFYAAAQRLTEETGIQHDVDHIVPLQGKNVSGLHVPWNLQVLEADKNRSKHNRFDDWGLEANEVPNGSESEKAD